MRTKRHGRAGLNSHLLELVKHGGHIAGLVLISIAQCFIDRIDDYENEFTMAKHRHEITHQVLDALTVPAEIPHYKLIGLERDPLS